MFYLTTHSTHFIYGYMASGTFYKDNSARSKTLISIYIYIAKYFNFFTSIRPLIIEPPTPTPQRDFLDLLLDEVNFPKSRDLALLRSRLNASNRLR